MAALVATKVDGVLPTGDTTTSKAVYFGAQPAHAAFLQSQPNVRLIRVGYAKGDYAKGGSHHEDKAPGPEAAAELVFGDLSGSSGPLPRAAHGAQLLLCLHVLEHLPSLEAGLRQLGSIASPGAWLQVEVPCNPFGASARCVRTATEQRAMTAPARVAHKKEKKQQHQQHQQQARRREGRRLRAVSAAERLALGSLLLVGDLCKQHDHAVVHNCSSFRTAVEQSGWACKPALEALGVHHPRQLRRYGLAGVMGADRQRHTDSDGDGTERGATTRHDINLQLLCSRRS